MFSSIRSYLLGSSAPVETKLQSEVSDLPSPSGNHESSLLELTLNAATSKITEQLLPPSVSIEQLQSSSHQLLPSLNEQAKEDELKKLKKESESSSNINDQATEDDEECFNDDSWELLDLVEKPSISAAQNLKDQDVSSNSTVQDVVSVNMSTLLAHHGDEVKTCSTIEEPVVIVRNQKQLKVSFREPDLVMKQELKNENQVDSAIIRTKTATKKNKKNKNKNNKHNVNTTSNLKVTDLKKKVEGPSLKKIEPEPIVSISPTIKPILNYAQVLKPKSSEALLTSQVKAATPIKVTTLKRNRTVSTTSWSSGDESDMVAKFWDEDITADTAIVEVPHQVADNTKCVKEVQPEVNEVENNVAMNESMLSSTFSDFDYRYQQINDFVLKAGKRSNKKHKRSSSTSSISKKSTLHENAKKTTGDDETNDGVTTPSSKSCKLNSHKFKGKKNVSNSVLITSSSNFVKLTAIAKPSDTTKLEQKGKKNHDSASFMKTEFPPCPVYSSVECTDSSDTPDMDESWFVTPPPCFTNVNKTKSSQSKLKQAYRENELIEHPSVYFSTSVKHSENEVMVDATIHEKVGTKSKVDRVKVQNVTKMTNNSKSHNVSKPESKKLMAVDADKKKNNVSCGNKFVVTNWAFDEQDDLDDFDNMFENESFFKEVPKVSLKKKGKKNRGKIAYELIHSESPIFIDESDGSDSLQNSSPVSVELDEISSLSIDGDMTNANDSTEAVDEELPIDENHLPVEAKKWAKKSGEKKAPVPVQPIKPERKPGWQLKRKRNKRRFLNSSMPLNQGTVKTIKDHYSYADSSSNSTSQRSSPSIIDRIGSTIVANLTNLTCDFPGSSGSSIQSREPMRELDNSIALRKSSSDLELMNRKKLSKSYLDRQNGCAKLGNSNRREGRGLKMHKTFNGYSVDRKVQTNFPKTQ